MGMLQVVMSENEKLIGHRFPLHQENRLGKNRKCDIKLKDKKAKPFHAIIAQKGNKIILTPLAPLYLNGKKINDNVELFSGDEIELGQTVLELNIAGSKKFDYSQKRRIAEPAFRKDISNVKRKKASLSANEQYFYAPDERYYNDKYQADNNSDESYDEDQFGDDEYDDEQSDEQYDYDEHEDDYDDYYESFEPESERDGYFRF